MSGTLFVVATPIGNLEDITLRALRVLREVDLIAAEDTRRTAKLLAHHGIATPTISFHSHNARGRLPNLLQRLRNGESIALVSDAGTPGISDPGEELVRACIEYQVRIDPLPGATAPLTAVVASGFPLVPLTVYGFAPHRSKDRIAWFTSICSVQHTFTFFESPQRISGSLADGSVIFGDRPIIVARELTKMHQEIVRGTFAELSSRFTAAKGEFTVVVGPANQVPSPVEPVSDAEIVAAFRSKGQIATGKRRAIVSELARRYNRPSREIYKIIEQAKDSGE